MKFLARLLITALCLVMLSLAASLTPPQEEKKTEDATAPKKTEEKAKQKPASATIHVAVVTSNSKELPGESSIELRSESEGCNGMTSVETDIHSGKATFEDVPVCKVRFLIFVTGFDSKGISVDLSKCKEPITITIDSQSSPKVKCS